MKAVTDFHPVGIRGSFSNTKYSKLVKGQIGLVQKFKGNWQNILLRVSWNLNPQEEQVYSGIPKEVVYCCQLAGDTDSLPQEQEPLAQRLPTNSNSKDGLPGVERPTSTGLPNASTFSTNAATKFSFGGSESKPIFGTPTAANYIFSATASKPSFGTPTIANYIFSDSESKPSFGTPTANYIFSATESKPSFGTATANYIFSATKSKPSFGTQVTKSTLGGTAANFCISGSTSKPIFGKKIDMI